MCRSPAGENGRHLLSIWSGIAGEPASPVGDSSALLAVLERQGRSADDGLCPAVRAVLFNRPHSLYIRRIGSKIMHKTSIFGTDAPSTV
jgi:hypothetical protein